jgi:hypothetical protein
VRDRNKIAEAGFVAGNLLCGIEEFAPPTPITGQAGKKLLNLLAWSVADVFSDGSHVFIVLIVHHCFPVRILLLVIRNPSAAINRPSLSDVKSRSPLAKRPSVRCSSPAAFAIAYTVRPSLRIAARIWSGRVWSLVI